MRYFPIRGQWISYDLREHCGSKDGGVNTRNPCSRSDSRSLSRCGGQGLGNSQGTKAANLGLRFKEPGDDDDLRADILCTAILCSILLTSRQNNHEK